METGTLFYARQHGRGLTLAQRNAVDLLAAGKTDTEAAGLLGLHRTTISKWRLYDVEFQAALNRRRAEVWEAGIDRLRALIPQALDVLAAQMVDPDGSDRVKAAVALLKLVPLPPAALAPGPADPGEIVRRIATRRRELKPSTIENLMDLRQGRPGLEDQCYEIQMELERLVDEEDEEDEDAPAPPHAAGRRAKAD
jgi:hypothetical protein